VNVTKAIVKAACNPQLFNENDCFAIRGLLSFVGNISY
jgi:hypothetical protein